MCDERGEEDRRLTYTLPHLYTDCTARLGHLLGRSVLHFPGFGASRYQHQKAMCFSRLHPKILAMGCGCRDGRSIIIHNA